MLYFFLHEKKRREIFTERLEGENNPGACDEKNDQFLSPTDRLTYIYIFDINANVTTEVVNVSYEIKIEGDWQTIIRYDSAHGHLHKHSRVSLNDEKEITTREGVKQKGDPKSWLTWAIQDIQKHFVEYRRLFYKRSGIMDAFY